MVKILEKINDAEKVAGQPYFSFEFFPPKTEAGVENLYLRMESMTALQPIFVDITWGAGGSTKDLTMAIAQYTQTYFGMEVLMHLTCTNMTIEELKGVLNAARDAKIHNILALRGDPPKGAVEWQPVKGGCQNAIDLVRLIKREHGDYFGVAVAGFPDGHPQSAGNADADITYLKEKVDAGADFVLTNYFYEPTVFISYLAKCRAAGITCPIIPGMMPIQSYSSFSRMTRYSGARVPDSVWDELNPIRDDDAAVKAYGVRLCSEMCKTLIEAGVPGFHFYTLNLEKSVLKILKDLEIDETAAARRPLPWRGARCSSKKDLSMSTGGSGLLLPSSRSSSSLSREDVRPINWANRPKSYITRTVSWDEFPNGRWGDGRSPAFGELSDTHFYHSIDGRTKADRLTMWGEAPVTPQDVFEIFAKYVEGKIPIIPWCENPLQAETEEISSPLAAMNRSGILTINSQPAVNGERSDHPQFGWGGPGGRVYQKAYVEFFVSPGDLAIVNAVVNKRPSLSLYAVDSTRTLKNFTAPGSPSTPSTPKSPSAVGVTAVTWGVFPDKEVLQPTVFDPETFLVWSEEAFRLWTDAWAALYDECSASNELLYQIHDTFFLVAIIDNDYVDSSLFSIFAEIQAAKSEAKVDAIEEEELGMQGLQVDEEGN